MNLREQLNRKHYQQAVQFADNFADKERAEFIEETTQRQIFEQAQFLTIISRNLPFVRWISGVLFLIIIAAAAVYWQSGRYFVVSDGIEAFEQFQQIRTAQSREVQNDSYIVNLQNRLRLDPNDGDLWFELAQAYALNNEFENALICYRNAEGILGRRAAILGGMASVEYYRHRHQLTSQAKEWIDEALELSPNESASHLILASDAFLHNDFQSAIFHWERVLSSENPAVDRREVIRSIQTAKARLTAQ